MDMQESYNRKAASAQRDMKEVMENFLGQLEDLAGMVIIAVARDGKAFKLPDGDVVDGVGTMIATNEVYLHALKSKAREVADSPMMHREGARPRMNMDMLARMLEEQE